MRHLRDHGATMNESSSTIANLESDRKRLQMEVKMLLRKDEAQERETATAVTEAVNLKERNKALQITLAEKERQIKASRTGDHERIQMTRDFDLQRTMLDKLQQQLVDEKVQSQNLIADAKAATKRAEKLQRIELENEEYRSRVRQLERDVAEKIDTANHVQEGVGELRSDLEAIRYQLQKKRMKMTHYVTGSTLWKV